MTIPRLELIDIHKSFGIKQVLRGISLSVHAGESLAIIGGSGTGKSVTLKCILGVLQPDKGQVIVDGTDITRLDLSKRSTLMKRIGMLFQGAALFDSLPVWENIAFALLSEQRLSRRIAKEQAVAALPAVGLKPEIADAMPADLSGGMQKRVGLARAIITKPDIMFFDEPTTGLDPIAGDLINKLIVKQVRELGASAVTITHDMHSAKQIADKIVMLHQGQVVWAGSTAELETTDNPYIRQFVAGDTQGPIPITPGDDRIVDRRTHPRN